MEIKKKKVEELVNQSLNIISGSAPDYDINADTESTKTTDQNVKMSRQTDSSSYFKLIGLYPFIESEDAENEEDTKDSLLEKLSALEHEQWEKWSKNIVKNENISKERIDRWKSYWSVPYDKLDEKTKDFDREWAKKAMKIFKDHVDGNIKKNEEKKSIQEVEDIIEKIVNRGEEVDILDSDQSLPTVEDITDPIIKKKLSDLIEVINMDSKEDSEINKLASVSGLLDLLVNKLSNTAKNKLIKKIKGFNENTID